MISSHMQWLLIVSTIVYFYAQIILDLPVVFSKADSMFLDMSLTSYEHFLPLWPLSPLVVSHSILKEGRFQSQVLIGCF